MTAPIDQFWLSGWASSGTTGTIVASQGAQSGAIVAIERYVVTAAVAQSVQTGALAGTEATVATVAGMQAGQTGAIAGTMRIVVVGAPAQSPQTGAVTGIERTLGALSPSQPVQSGALASGQRFLALGVSGQPTQSASIASTTTSADAPAAEPSARRHGFDRIPDRQTVTKTSTVLAVIAGVQSSQRSRIAARTNDDDLAYLYLELAA